MREEGIPEETETIAVKRSARVFEKYSRFGGKLNITRSWWNGVVFDVAVSSFLIILNLFSVSVFLSKKVPDVGFSGPVIPFLTGTLEKFGFESFDALRFVYFFFYLLFPVGFYFFISKVSERRSIALIAALISILPFYPFGGFRAGMAFLAVEGPHISSLTLMPLGVYALLLFVRKGGYKNLVIASVLSSLIALISPFGFFTFLMFSVIIVFSEILLGSGRLKILRFLFLMLISASFCSFWYNPGFFYWMITGPMGDEFGEVLFKLLPVSFFVVPVVGVFGYLFFDRRPNLQSLFLAVFFTVVFGLVVFAGGGFVISGPSRYTSELGISLSFLLAVLYVQIIDRVRFRTGDNFLGLKRLFAANLLLSLVLMFFVFVILSKNNTFYIESDVLGVSSNVTKGDIWLAREKSSGIMSYSGYMITATSAVILSAMGMKSKNKGSSGG